MIELTLPGERQVTLIIINTFLFLQPQLLVKQVDWNIAWIIVYLVHRKR